MSSDRVRLLLVAATIVAAAATLRTSTPAFLPDDPIQVDDDRLMDAGGAVPIEGSNAYDFAEQTFFKPGERRPIPAVNVNTMGEVPDSSWFTNRIGRREMTLAELVRGPNTLDDVNVDGWPIVQEKSSGITPGYRITDPSGHLYQLKFDPPAHPEMSSGAEVIGAAVYHALGYNVVEGYIVEIDPERIVIAEHATTVDLSGRTRQMDRRDIDRILARVARQPNGKYRAMLSRFAEGTSLGYFKYYGTRPDDPNDIHPHEHRRELRGNRVFAAWLNHDDSRALNSLDMLEGPVGRQYIKHYMFDFGSIMGSGSTMAQVPRAGNEYILEWAPALKTLATLGLYVRPWITVDYWTEAKSVGHFESTFFDPLKWKPEYPNPAFDNMQPEDAFWAAELVSRFSDEMIRAIVAKARYSEPGAAEHIAATLIERRDKVLRTWLTMVNPLLDPRLDAAGVLTFRNAAVHAGIAAPARSYRVTWQEFDNATGQARGQAATVESAEPRAAVPPGLLQNAAFVTASIETHHDQYAHWTKPVRFTFRRTPNGWQAVGVGR
jgi:hypothetical protein